VLFMERDADLRVSTIWLTGSRANDVTAPAARNFGRRQELHVLNFGNYSHALKFPSSRQLGHQKSADMIVEVLQKFVKVRFERPPGAQKTNSKISAPVSSESLLRLDCEFEDAEETRDMPSPG